MNTQISTSVYGIQQPSALLEQFLMQNSSSESDWLRAAALVSDRDEKRYCLGCALYINPRSEVAKQQLDRFDQVDQAVPLSAANTSIWTRIRGFFSLRRPYKSDALVRI